MIDLETRIRNEIMKPQHTNDTIMIEGLTEVAQKVHDLNVVMNEEIQNLNRNTKSLLLEHLERVEKSNKTYHDQLETTSLTLQHLLNALLIDPDDYPTESEQAWKDCREATKTYLESRVKN